MKHRIHPAAELFPMMSDEEIDKLAASIKANGQRQAVVLFNSQVVDGRNRLVACERAGVEPRTIEWDGKGSLIDFVLAANLHRRHLTQDQRAVIASKTVPMYEAEAKERQRRAGGDRRAVTAPRAGSVDPNKGTAAAQAARATTVGTRTVERARFVGKNSPALEAEVLAGSKSLKQAEREIKRATEVARIKVYRPPAGEYAVIVNDPPWPYDDALDGSDAARGGLPYQPMTLEAICAMPIPAAADCALWLWVTNAHLIDGSAAKVLAAWGFEPKTLLTWDKMRMGAGRWLRNVTEHCILAVKGKPIVEGASTTTLLQAPRTGHSEKPAKFFELVEKICPSKSRLEMFARASREGWATTGAELPRKPVGRAEREKAEFDGWREELRTSAPPEPPPKRKRLQIEDRAS